jgi:hypothetical protein
MMNFNYSGKNYEILEPTIDTWSKLVLLQEWDSEREFCVKLLSFSTGLSEQEIENSDPFEVVDAAERLNKIFLENSNKFYNEFEFKDKKYKFIDLPNLTFGEYIDIDSYLSKEPHEKKKEMNLLMAMLYRELDSNGNYLPYNSKELQTKAELFKSLPVKYVNGSTNFFFHLDRISRGNFKLSLNLRLKLMVKMIWTLVKAIPLISTGVGLLHLSRWREKILRRLKKLLHIR